MAKNGAFRDDILNYSKEHFGGVPEYPRISLPNYAALQRTDNKKRYAVIMNIERSKLGLNGSGRVDIMEIKCDPLSRDLLRKHKGFVTAYHLKRDNWIGVLLDGSADKSIVFELLEESYELAKCMTKNKRRTEPKDWLVPVNPKYFDIEKAFSESNTLLWKQSSSIIVGDIIYLYIAAPCSSIMYRCKAIEADIPYNYDDGKVHMQKVMKIQLLHTYGKNTFGLELLREHGISSVRGPRSIPYGLLCKLEKEIGNSEM